MVEGAPGFASPTEKQGGGSNALFRVDEMEAKLFAAKQGLRHAQYQHNNGSLSDEAFQEVEQHYENQIRSTSKELRNANMDLRKQTKNGKGTKRASSTKRENNESFPGKSWPKKTSKKSQKKK